MITQANLGVKQITGLRSQEDSDLNMSQENLSHEPWAKLML